MAYHNLTNEEIVFLYYMSASVISQYEETFTDETIIQSLPTNNGVIEVTIGLPKDFVEEIMQSKHYTIMKDVNNKLKPIYELIKDVEPEIVAVIDDLFIKKLN